MFVCTYIAPLCNLFRARSSLASSIIFEKYVWYSWLPDYSLPCVFMITSSVKWLPLMKSRSVSSIRLTNIENPFSSPKESCMQLVAAICSWALTDTKWLGSKSAQAGMYHRKCSWKCWQVARAMSNVYYTVPPRSLEIHLLVVWQWVWAGPCVKRIMKSSEYWNRNRRLTN